MTSTGSRLCLAGSRLRLVGSRPCLGGSRLRLVAEVRERFQGRRPGRHLFSPELGQGQRMTGDVEQLIVAFLAPILEGILVEQVDVLGDLSLAQHLFIFLLAGANHARHQGGGGGEMIGGEGRPLVSR